jgi:hypothetical protein
VSVNKLQDGEHRWDYYEQFTPVEWIGYTMRIYHITLEDANAMRRKYGMPLLPLTPAATQSATLPTTQRQTGMSAPPTGVSPTTAPTTQGGGHDRDGR